MLETLRLFPMVSIWMGATVIGLGVIAVIYFEQKAWEKIHGPLQLYGQAVEPKPRHLPEPESSSLLPFGSYELDDVIGKDPLLTNKTIELTQKPLIRRRYPMDRRPLSRKQLYYIAQAESLHRRH